jgi:NAD(P)-dependent dehydrogenase (short-subunit alcohol dehydrogenase family)
MERFEGRNAIVTAAGAGIGRATALRLAREGARVACVDISPAVAETAREIEAAGGVAKSWQMDVTDRKLVERTFAEIERAIGDTDVLVNGVGRSAAEKLGEFWKSDPAVWDEVITISLKSTMLCCRQIVPGMRERRRGRVVNISSVSWLMPTPTFAEYAASKAGVVGFTRVLAIELAPFGVTVNAVSPGPIETAATRKHSEETRRRVMSTIPMGHYGEPDDIAGGVAYLASDDAKFVTAQNLVIGGGRGIV